MRFSMAKTLQVGHSYYDGCGCQWTILTSSVNNAGVTVFLGVSYDSDFESGMSAAYFLSDGSRFGTTSQKFRLRVLDLHDLKKDDVIGLRGACGEYTRHVHRVGMESGDVLVYSHGVSSRTYDPSKNHIIGEKLSSITRVIEIEE
jgi:hypothetical protein